MQIRFFIAAIAVATLVGGCNNGGKEEQSQPKRQETNTKQPALAAKSEQAVKIKEEKEKTASHEIESPNKTKELQTSPKAEQKESEQIEKSVPKNEAEKETKQTEDTKLSVPEDKSSKDGEKAESTENGSEGSESTEKKAGQTAADDQNGDSKKDNPPASASADTGAKLYKKCVVCHGSDGKTKAMGKSEIIAGQKKEEIVEKLKGYQSGKLNVAGMGTLMKGQVEGLSSEDIDSLAGYISALK